MGAKRTHTPFMGVLYISTRVWVLRTPNAGRNMFFLTFKWQKAPKAKKIADKLFFFPKKLFLEKSRN